MEQKAEGGSGDDDHSDMRGLGTARQWIRRELPHSKCAGFGFPYRMVFSRILLTKPGSSTFCFIHPC